MTDFDMRRILMVETQLRPNEVTDRRLLAAMRALPRELFVPESLQGLAYMDEDIRVLRARDGAPARYLLSPMVQAQLLQLAEVTPGERVLDVGCATGYSTAVLLGLGAKAVGLEPEPKLVAAAKRNLKATNPEITKLAADAGISAEVVAGDLTLGHAAGAPYDAIIVEGSVPHVPDALLSQLREGGRLVTVRTRRPNMRQGKAYLFVRVEGEARGTAQFDAGAPPLPGFAPAPAFAF